MPSVKREQLAAMNWHYKRFSLEYCLKALEKIGFSSIAFWAGPPHFQIDDCGYEDISALARQLEEHHLKCVSFTACASHQMYQFGIDGEEHIRQAYRYFTNGIHAASELEVPLMTVNAGNGFFNMPRANAWKRACELLHRVAEEGRRCGVTLTVESSRPQETRTAVTLQDMKRLLNDVGHPDCKAMIDTTAMGASNETVWEWFEAFGDDIRNLHFIDSGPAGHLAWGDGIFPLDDMLRCLNRYRYTGPICFEITHERYWHTPEKADAQTFKIMERYLEG